MTNGIKATDFSDITNTVTIDSPFTPYSTNPFQNPNYYHMYQYTPPPTPPHVYHHIQPPPEPQYHFYTTHQTPYISTSPMLISDTTKCFLHQLDNKVTHLDEKLAQIRMLIERKNRIYESVFEGRLEVCEGNTQYRNSMEVVANDQLEDKCNRIIQILEKMENRFANLSKPVTEMASNKVNQSSTMPTSVSIVDNLDNLSRVEKITDDNSEDSIQLQVSQPTNPAPHMFDESPERVLAIDCRNKLTKNMMNATHVFDVSFETRYDEVMIYKLHEDERGKVLTGVKIIVDGQKGLITDKEGFYKLDQVTSKRYTIEAKKEHYKFDKLHDFMVLPNMDSVVDIKAISYDVCGLVDTISPGCKAEVTLTHRSENVKPQVKQTVGNGNFCFEVQAGKYRLSSFVAKPESAPELLLLPPYVNVNVNKPLLNIRFHQAQVNVIGLVMCKENCGSFVYVTIVRLGGSSKKERKSISLTDQSSEFDISSAVYGSQRYVLFSPKVLSSAQVTYEGKPLDEVISEVLKGKWDHVRTKFSLPPLMILLFGEPETGGSSTPSMVGAVKKWQNSDPQRSRDTWTKLSNANSALEKQLNLLRKLAAEHPDAYQCVINNCCIRKSGEWMEAFYQSGLLVEIERGRSLYAKEFRLEREIRYAIRMHVHLMEIQAPNQAIGELYSIRNQKFGHVFDKMEKTSTPIYNHNAVVRSLNVLLNFTEATMISRKKCFRMDVERCQVDSLSSFVISCSGGQLFVIDTSYFHILWNAIHAELMVTGVYNLRKSYRVVKNSFYPGAELDGPGWILDYVKVHVLNVEVIQILKDYKYSVLRQGITEIDKDFLTRKELGKSSSLDMAIAYKRTSVLIVSILTNTTLPSQKKQVLSNYCDDQPYVMVHVFKCERTRIKVHNFLGLFELSGSPFLARRIALSWYWCVTILVFDPGLWLLQNVYKLDSSFILEDKDDFKRGYMSRSSKRMILLVLGMCYPKTKPNQQQTQQLKPKFLVSTLHLIASVYITDVCIFPDHEMRI